LSPDTSKSSIRQSKDLDSQNDTNKYLNRKKSPVHNEKIRKKIERSYYKKHSAPLHGGPNDSTSSNSGVKEKPLAGSRIVS
jgi:hypothetical protein